MMDILIKYVNITNNNLNKQNLKGTTCLWIACCNNKIDMVFCLLNLGADPNLANFKGDSPIIPCCQKGLDKIVLALLESGARIDSFNKHRDSPVILCCRVGQHKILDLILSRLNNNELMEQLTIKASIDGFNDLLAATEQNKAECIKTCLKYGADLEFRTDIDNPIISGATSLHLACFYGKSKAAEMLIDLGADVKSKTLSSLQTPLHLAVKHGCISVVRLLMKQNQSKECLLMKDKDEKTPGYYATMMGNEEIYDEFFRNKLAEMLMKIMICSNLELEKKSVEIITNHAKAFFCYTHRDIIEITYTNGSSILSEAIITGNYLLAEKLISFGADINKFDDYKISLAFWMLLFDFKASITKSKNYSI